MRQGPCSGRERKERRFGGRVGSRRRSCQPLHVIWGRFVHRVEGVAADVCTDGCCRLPGGGGRDRRGPCAAAGGVNAGGGGVSAGGPDLRSGTSSGCRR